MKLIFLGTGAAFTVGAGNYNSNMLLESDSQQKLLIDCGSDARHSLHELKFSQRDIDGVYVSHLHADHAGGLEWFAFSAMFDAQRADKPKLYISQDMAADLWNKVLAGGLSSLEGVIADLSTYFNVQLSKDHQFVWEGITFRLIKTLHATNGFTPMPSYGLFFTANQIKVFITTDTQFSKEYYQEYYRRADIIFHDCELTVVGSGVHAHYAELLTLDLEIRNKIWLYHYDAATLPDAKKDGFRGFVKKGQCFDFTDRKTL